MYTMSYIKGNQPFYKFKHFNQVSKRKKLKNKYFAFSGREANSLFNFTLKYGNSMFDNKKYIF